MVRLAGFLHSTGKLGLFHTHHWRPEQISPGIHTQSDDKNATTQKE
jgi:hypothetical protein